MPEQFDAVADFLSRRAPSLSLENQMDADVGELEGPPNSFLQRTVQKVGDFGNNLYRRVFQNQPEAVEAAERYGESTTGGAIGHDTSADDAGRSAFWDELDRQWGPTAATLGGGAYRLLSGTATPAERAGAKAGAAEGAAENLTSAVDVAATVGGPFAKGAGLVGKVARGAMGLQAARGAINTGSAAKDIHDRGLTPQNAGQLFGGVAEAAMAGAGFAGERAPELPLVDRTRNPFEPHPKDWQSKSTYRPYYDILEPEQTGLAGGPRPPSSPPDIDVQGPPQLETSHGALVRQPGQFDAVEQFLADREPAAAPPRYDVMHGEEVPDPSLPARPEQRQLPPASVAAWFADEGGIATPTAPGERLPESRQLGRAPLLTPPPREPFTGSPSMATTMLNELTDDELRRSFVEAGTMADTRSLNELHAEIQRRAASNPQQPSQTLEQMLAPNENATTAQPTAPHATGEQLASGMKPGDIVSFTPDQVGQIAIDPATYQFKTGDVRGRTGALEGVTAWDPDSPPITVHQREDGKLFVADGHQRFNKYLDLMQQGAELPPLRVRLKTGPVESIVRGASLRNVQEGSAEALDIARLIRNGGELTEGELQRIPKKNMAGAKLRQGQGLAKLSDDAFNQVLAGAAKPEQAARVGDLVADPAQQATIVNALGRAELPNATQADAFIRSMLGADFENVEQVDLFGNKIVAESLAKPRAQVVDAVMRELGSQKAAFGNALRNAERLEAAGNVLSGAENRRLADEAGKIRSYFDLLYDKVGTETNTALKEAALAVHGGKSATEAARPVADAVRRDLESGNFGQAAKVGGPAGPGDDGQLVAGAVRPPASEAPAGAAAALKPTQPVIHGTAAPDLQLLDSITLPEPVETGAKAIAEPDWMHRPDGGFEQQQGEQHVVRYESKPPDSVRAKLKADGYRYDYRDQTWRRSGPAAVESTPAVQQNAAPKAAEEVPPTQGVTQAESKPTLPTKAEQLVKVGRQAQKRLDKLAAHQVAKDAIGDVPESIKARASAAMALRDSLKEWPGREGNPREAGTAPRQVAARAERIAALLENPTPENFEALKKEWLDQADRWQKRQLVGGTSKEDVLPKRDEHGVDLASGFAGLEQMFKKNPRLAIRLTGMAVGAVVQSRRDEKDPLRGAIVGGLVGAFAPELIHKGGVAFANGASGEWSFIKRLVRDTQPPRPKGQLPKIKPDVDMTRDLYAHEQFFTPEGNIPKETYRKLLTAYEEREAFLSGHGWPEWKPDTIKDLLGSKVAPGKPKPGIPHKPTLQADPYADVRGLDPNDPRSRHQSGAIYAEGLRDLRKMADELRKAQPRRAAYIDRLVDAISEKNTSAQKLVDNLSGMPGLGKRVDSITTNHLYRMTLGFALDTGIQNRTQVGLNLKNVPAKYVVAAEKAIRTPEGKELTAPLKLHRPEGVEGGFKSGSLLGRALAAYDEFGGYPMLSTDTADRQASYIAHRLYAEDLGASPEKAHEWALQGTRQTQLQPGPLGASPYLRELGPLKAFKKYPLGWAEMMADMIRLRHENPDSLRRMVAYMVGAGLVGRALGINPLPFLIPRFGIADAGVNAGVDLYHHAVGDADHRLKEDVPSMLIPRYPRKVFEEAQHFFGGPKTPGGAHIVRNEKGQEKSRHTPLEGIEGLLGFQSTRQANERQTRDDIYSFLQDRRNTRGLDMRERQAAVAAAVDSGDMDALRAAVAGLPKATAKSMLRAVRQSSIDRMRRQVPKANRREFEQLFRDRIQQTELQ